MEYIFPKIAFVYYIGIGTIVLGVLLLLGLVWGKKGPFTYIFSCMVCVIVGVFIIYVSKGGKLVIENKTVKLKVLMYSEKIISAENISEIRIINIDSDSLYKPVKKTSGTATKNFRSGWFKLKNGEKAFLLLEGRKGIYVKTQAGERYIFGIKDFKKLEQVFEREVGRIGGDVEK